jgi:hypothetical protein
MSKLIITLPDELHTALNEMAAKEDKVVAAIVRRLISEYLAERGIHIDPTMRWGSGGVRRSDPDANKE